MEQYPATPIGVLLMEYGEPTHVDEVETYLRAHFGGHTPPLEMVDYLRQRFLTVWQGDTADPVPPRIAMALAAELAQRAGDHYRVTCAARHWQPDLETGLRTLMAQGVQAVIVLPLTPHTSQMALRDYQQALAQAQQRVSVPALRLIETWGELPALHTLWVSHAQAARDRLPAAVQHEAVLICCAHSVAESTRKPEADYRAQLEATSAAVAAQAGFGQWRLAFHSAEGPGQWLGPDVIALLDLLAAEGVRAVCYLSIGAIYDNVELCYELDARAVQRGAALGLHVTRAALPNAAPLLISGLADLVVESPIR